MLFLFAVFVFNVHLQAEQHFVAPLFQRAPAIDGTISDGEWDRACGFDGLKWRGVLEERSARVYVGATETNIYVALRSELPPEGPLKGEVHQNTTKVVYDDAMEVFIDPAPARQRGTAYQMLTSITGAVAYSAKSRGGAPREPRWSGEYRIQHKLHDRWWITEVAVPLASVSKGRHITEGLWGINVCRDWKQPWKFSSLGPEGYSPRPLLFRFQKDALAIQYTNHADLYSRTIDGSIAFRNSSAEDKKVNAVFELERNTMPVLKKRETITIEHGARERVTFKHRETNADSFTLTVKVTSEDGEELYRQFYRWGRPRKKRWEAERIVVTPLDFMFSHYPYLEKMRICADASGLKEDAELASLTFAIKKRGTIEPVKTVVFDMAGEKQKEELFPVPAFNGMYEIEMTAQGRNVPSEPVVKSFVRKKYEWEQNSLGTSTKVYPPFTPIKISGRTLHMVLKKYTLSDTALVSDVVAKGEQLLASPVHFEVRTEGKERTVEADLRITRAEGHVVETESRIEAGAFSATARGRWDYDGTLRYDLHMAPSEGKTVDKLALVVPLKNRLAPMLHAMTEGIRSPVLTARLPAGEGVIWTSDELEHFDMPQGFCSYIFLGSPCRGISWFAENDFGWSWDRRTPSLELVRSGNTLSMIVHLINKPLVITKPRRLTFGLLAAPVKPRLDPHGPHSWRHAWWTDRYTLLGTNINWLSAPGHASEVYPPGKDLSFWKMLARANVDELPRETIEQVAGRGKPYFRPWGDDEVERWVRHVHHNLRARRGKTMVFYYNRAVNKTNPEYATFMNEWVLTDYTPHTFRPDLGEIKYVPSGSLIDFSLYWYEQSFRFGRNRGVYWDNWFFKPSFNRVMTDAYRDADGTIVPATGLWGLRELAKRTFVMMCEKRMLPITMAHMTSTNILPLHSFATVQYDWEWRYSTGDVQYRFPREYLLLVSNGALAGTWPVLLGDHGKQARDEWTQRTFAGVSLVHELIGGGGGAVWKSLRDPLLPLLQHPALKVYTYWGGEPQPVTTKNADLPVIVYCIPGVKTAAVLCSYSEKEEQVKLEINPSVLKLNKSYTVENMETGRRYEMRDNAVSLQVKKHEVIGFRMEPQAKNETEHGEK